MLGEKNISAQECKPRQSTILEQVVTELKNNSDNLADGLGLFESKIKRLDDICDKLSHGTYPKNMPQNGAINGQSCGDKPQSDGLIGEFDSIIDRQIYLNNGFKNNLIVSLDVCIEFLETFI